LLLLLLPLLLTIAREKEEGLARDEALGEASWQLAEAQAEAAAVGPLESRVADVSSNTCQSSVIAQCYVTLLPEYMCITVAEHLELCDASADVLMILV
jgi:hypothetical protein